MYPQGIGSVIGSNVYRKICIGGNINGKRWKQKRNALYVVDGIMQSPEINMKLAMG
jgi:hypothetical protein